MRSIFCKLFIVLFFVSIFSFSSEVLAQSTQTWSESGIRDIVKDELKGTDIDSVKAVIKKESEDFEVRLESRLNQQQNNFIEIIGLFSAVLALIIGDVSIMKGSKGTKETFCLMGIFNISLLLFVGLVCFLF